jgi:hypothetical protein
MNTGHLHSFLDAMHRLDIKGAASYIADDIVVRTPIMHEPIKGKVKILPVLTHLLAIAEKYEAVEVMTGKDHFAVIHRFKFGGVEIEGVDYVHQNQAGLIDGLAVMWRPLPAVVAVQALVAPILGVPALKLVPAT